MSALPPVRRKLNRGHFSFMRALVQGLDLRQSGAFLWAADGQDGPRDERQLRSMVAWIRGEFAAAAKRHAKPGTARLVLLDVGQVDDAATAAPAPPTLEEFALAHGMEEFSEAEQAEAYAEAYPDAGGSKPARSRRARLIAKQLEALRWLELLVAEEPHAGDGVGAWLLPELAERLDRAGVPTLFALVERINAKGQRWWSGVPGIGPIKAARIVEWLSLYQDSIGMPIGAHAVKPRPQLLPAELARVVPPATALVPLEKFVVPADLDGRAGRFRAPRERCLLEADNDLQAIQAWLASKRSAQGGSASREGPTHRAYRKEAERLLLWAILERRRPLSSLTVEDATAYLAFLQVPPASWCGPRHHQRWSPLWRPLEGPLSVSAQRYAVTVLASLYVFLVAQNYVVGNPFAGVAMPQERGRRIGSQRTLSIATWDAIAASLAAKAEQATPAGRRRARAVRWLYATGLRISELAAARCANLVRLDLESGRVGWVLTVVGKGGKVREVPVPAGLVGALSAELVNASQPADVLDPKNAAVAILANLPESLEPWSASAIYKAIKVAFAQAASGLEGADAARLKAASPHWLRHSHGSHALNGRPGHKPVPLQVVQNNLGHASLGTTSGYLQTELEERVKAMEEFWS